MSEGRTSGAPFARGLACAVCLCAPATLAQTTDAEARAILDAKQPHISIQRVPRAPELAEFLDMRPPADLAESMTMVTGFVQQDPADGRPATQKTEVYLGYDDENFYAVFVAFDDDPQQIRARLSRREQPFGDETVEIMLDTFHAQRRAMTFLANPLGIQWDAIWTEGGSGGGGGGGRNFDSAWDTVWQSDGKVTDRGYVVVFSIPFKSLRFHEQDEQTWGIILLRDIPRNNESAFWPRVSNRIEGRLNQAATMDGLRDISPGRNIWLIPFVGARSFDVLDLDNGQFQGGEEYDAGLDAKFVFQDNLTLDLTLNPDFSQVESDQPQVTVNQRFEVFFPERRPFFLENKDFFATEFNLVNTRRIAGPTSGARLTGKLGSWRIGTMLIDDEAPGELADPWSGDFGERALNGIFSVSRDISAQSNIGLLYTQRDFVDDSSKVASVHGRIKIGTNWESKFQAVHSDTVIYESPAGRERPERRTRTAFEDNAYNLLFNREGRKLEAHIHYEEIGPDFFTALGFIRRRDIRDAHTSWDYNFRPEGRALVRWGPNARVGRVVDFAGTRLDKSAEGGLSFEWRRSTRFNVNFEKSRELLRTQDFSDLTVNTDFDTSGYSVSFGTSWFKTWEVNGGYRRGKAINFVPVAGPPVPADRLSANAGVTLRLGRRTRIDGTALLSALDDPTSGKRIFTNQIYRTRINWQWDAKLSLRLIVQYDETEVNPTLSGLDPAEGFNGDVLVTYLVNPWTALYVGYNTNYRNYELIPGGALGFDGFNEVRLTNDDYFNDAEQVFVKFSYLFRL